MASRRQHEGVAASDPAGENDLRQLAALQFPPVADPPEHVRFRGVVLGPRHVRPPGNAADDVLGQGGEDRSRIAAVARNEELVRVQGQDPVGRVLGECIAGELGQDRGLAVERALVLPHLERNSFPREALQDLDRVVLAEVADDDHQIDPP